MNDARVYPGAGLKAASAWTRENLSWLLLLSCLVLFTTKTKFNLPIAIMTLAGLFVLIRHFREVVGHPGLRWFMLLFASIVVPMLLSLVDAVNPGRAAASTAKYLVFPLVLVYVLHAVGTGDSEQFRHRLFLGFGIIVSAWVLDGLLQYLVGYDLLGYPYEGGRVRGVFHPKHRLGTVSAALSPVFFDFVRRYGRRYKPVWLLAPAIVTVVVLAASRTAWMMLLVSIFLYAVYLALRFGTRKVVKWTGVFLLVAAVISVAAYQVPHVKRYVDTTALMFKGDFKSIDQATAFRLSLWQTAYHMIRGNPVNGIGPRGFRYVYREYAPKGNMWKSQTHPHQMTLEILVETGMIGLLGYLLFWVLLFRFLLRLPRERIEATVPWGLAAMVAAFPLNAHMAFYANYWSTITWWLLIIMVAMASTYKPAAK